MNIAKIELLAPARDLETGRVAVDAGADAVYIGGPGFGARYAAGNSVEDIAELVRYARPFGVRVYATLNTLLFDFELEQARRVATMLLSEAGVDALIVQDMAWLRMGLEGVTGLEVAGFGAVAGLEPEGSGPAGVEMHASTQVSNRVPEEVAFLGRAGFRRVILERALSIDEIREIRRACPDEMELEVFVHGAICVGYSGRCFLSRAMSGGVSVAGVAGAGLTDSAERGAGGCPRSGNRGDCSQPCRLAWDLTDGEGKVLIKGKHLLSVRDLDLSARVGELLDAGVTSLKIEGRLKDASYVRNVVSHYRRVLDAELARKPGFRRASAGVSRPDFEPDPAKSFTRGATEWFFGGVSREVSVSGGVASFDTPKAMGEAAGRVGRVGYERTGNGFFMLDSGAGRVAGARVSADAGGFGSVTIADRLAAGDGICFFSAGELRGTKVNRVEAGRIYPNRMDGIEVGMEMYRNYDHAYARALEHSRMRRRLGVSVRAIVGDAGVAAEFTDETGIAVEVSRQGVFEQARDEEKMAAVMRDELSRSGDTIFEVTGVEVEGTDLGSDFGGGSGLRFVPVSMLAAMRREGLTALLKARCEAMPVRMPAREDLSAPFVRTYLATDENVTNRLAERFWRDHGVCEIAPALELRMPAAGDAVMRSRYCIRRETGECLLGRQADFRDGVNFGEQSGSGEDLHRGREAKTGGELYLERGSVRLRLDFDCAACEMVVRVAKS